MIRPGMGRWIGLGAVMATVGLWGLTVGLAAGTKASEGAIVGGTARVPADQGRTVVSDEIEAGRWSAGLEWPAGCAARGTGAVSDTVFYVVRCVRPGRE